MSVIKRVREIERECDKEREGECDKERKGVSVIRKQRVCVSVINREK